VFLWDLVGCKEVYCCGMQGYLDMVREMGSCRLWVTGAVCQTGIVFSMLYNYNVRQMGQSRVRVNAVTDCENHGRREAI
jgi:hypothetical protein